MNKKTNITSEDIYESLKNAQKTLKEIVITMDSLINSTCKLSGGVSPINDFKSGLLGTMGYDNFYRNIINGYELDNIKYILKYVFDTKQNRKDFFKYINDTYGIVTPKTNRKILKPELANDDINLYIKYIIELFDCYKEIINYNSYIMPIDIEKRKIVIRSALKATQAIYDLIKDDLNTRFYSKYCLEQINMIIDTYEKGKKKIRLKDADKFRKELNENFFLRNDAKSLLYGDLITDFINEYNDGIDCLCANKFLNKLISILKQNGLDNSDKMLNKAIKLLSKEINKSQDEVFYLVLENLLDKEADLSYYGDSYTYYHAINELSVDCSCMLRGKKIYYDKQQIEEFINKVTK